MVFDRYEEPINFRWTAEFRGSVAQVGSSFGVEATPASGFGPTEPFLGLVNVMKVARSD